MGPFEDASRFEALLSPSRPDAGPAGRAARSRTIGAVSAEGPGNGKPQYERRDADRYHTGRDSWFTEGRRAATAARGPARTVHEPARETPVHDETDVLVVGGGPAGCAAAVAARRLGAEVTLVERHNHLGGLSTGGLVIWIDRMTDWEGKRGHHRLRLGDPRPPARRRGRRRAARAVGLDRARRSSRTGASA